MISSNGRACTIYSPRVDFGILRTLVERFGKEAVSREGPEDAWNSLRIETGGGSLRFTGKRRVQPGDDFSRTLLGTHSFLSRAGSSREILDSVLATSWLLGVVAEPGFDADPEFETAVLAIATELGGLIFTGTGMRLPSRGA